MTVKKYQDISLILRHLDDPIYCLDYLVNWSVHIEEIESLDLDAHTDLYLQLYKLKPSESSVFGRHYYRLLIDFFEKSPTETTLIWEFLQGFSNHANIYDDEDLFGYFINVIEYILRNDDSDGPVLPISQPSHFISELERVYHDVVSLNLTNNNLWNYCMYLLSIKMNKSSSEYLHRMGDYVPQHNNQKGQVQILFALMIQSIHAITNSLENKHKKRILKETLINLENVKSRAKDLQLKDYEYTASRLSEISKELMVCESFDMLLYEKTSSDMQLYLEELQKFCFSLDLASSVQNRQIPLFLRTFHDELSNDVLHKTTVCINGGINNKLTLDPDFIEACDLIVLYFHENDPIRIYVELCHILACSKEDENLFLRHFVELLAMFVNQDISDLKCREAMAHGDGLLKCMAYIVRGILYYNKQDLAMGFKLQMIGLNEMKLYVEANKYIGQVFTVYFEYYIGLLHTNNKLSYMDKIKFIEKKLHLMEMPMIPKAQ